MNYKTLLYQKQGFHKAVQWRDSGKPIPRGKKGA